MHLQTKTEPERILAVVWTLVFAVTADLALQHPGPFRVGLIGTT